MVSIVAGTYAQAVACARLLGVNGPSNFRFVHDPYQLRGLGRGVRVVFDETAYRHPRYSEIVDQCKACELEMFAAVSKLPEVDQALVDHAMGKATRRVSESLEMPSLMVRMALLAVLVDLKDDLLESVRAAVR